MGDAGVVAVAAGPAEQHDAAGVGGADRRARRHGDVDAGVQAAPAHAERRHDRAVDRPDHACPSPGGSGPAGRAAALRGLQLARARRPAPSRARRRSPSRSWRSSRVRDERLGLLVARTPWILAPAARRACSLTSTTSWWRRATTAVTSRWRSSSRSSRCSVATASALAVRTRSMMRASCSETRCMNSVALEQVGEAVGLEDHGHDVGLVGLVELDEPVAQRGARLGEPGAQPDEPDALLAQQVLQAGQLGALAGRGRPRSAPGASAAS